jgi:hypothetical protein
MEEYTWSAVAQAVIMAICTWFIRWKSTKDKTETQEKVIQSTASQTTSNEILSRVKALEVDMHLVKQAALKDGGIDHRGPTKGEKDGKGV